MSTTRSKCCRNLILILHKNARITLKSISPIISRLRKMALRNLIADLEPFARNPLLLRKATQAACGNDKKQQQEHLDELKENVKKVIKKHKLSPADYAQFVNYSDLGYTKNLVHSFNGSSNLIIMCWAPNQSSLWHAHEGSRCFVRCLRGNVLEQQARMPPATTATITDKGHEQFESGDTPTRVFQTTRMGEGDNEVHFIDDSIGLHKVRNLSADSGAVTMHFYTPAYTKCRVFKCHHDKEEYYYRDQEKQEANKIVTLCNNSKLVDVLFDNDNETGHRDCKNNERRY